MSQKTDPQLPQELSSATEADPRKLPDSVESLRDKVEEALAPVVPPDIQHEELVERVVEIVRAERFAGPLPHPKHLAAYEQIHPGLVDRIVAMAELAQQRTEDRQDTIIKREFDDRHFGMILGISALALFVVSGTILFLWDKTAAGSALFGAAALGTIVSSFVRGRGEFSWPWQREKEPPPAGPPAKT